MYNFNKLFGPANAPSRPLPQQMLAPEFGEVSVRQVDNRLQVAAALAMGAFLMGDGESCVAGLALDASQSMKDFYGRGRTVPEDVAKEYIAKGMFETSVRDGVQRRVLTQEAKQEAIRSGRVRTTDNLVHEPAMQMMDNLIRTFATGGATSGKCEVIYWACGQDGRATESLGQWSLAQLGAMRIEGPQKVPFGPTTHLAPPFRYFAAKSQNTYGVFVFVTDGHIDDEQEVVAETYRMAEEIKAGKRRSLKCVLLGVGKHVDTTQMARIDDLEMPDHLSDVDIWNAKLLTEMRDMNDAWSEIFDPDTVVGTSLRVTDERGQLLHEKTDEVKALITFEVPASVKAVDLVLDGEMKIHQPLA